jgi:hypothetical protein
MPTSHMQLYWAFILARFCFADQIVYLERPAHPPVNRAEPAFNPKTLTANVAEQIHFVATFGDQRPYYPGVLIPIYKFLHCIGLASARMGIRRVRL